MTRPAQQSSRQHTVQHTAHSPAYSPADSIQSSIQSSRQHTVQHTAYSPAYRAQRLSTSGQSDYPVFAQESGGGIEEEHPQHSSSTNLREGGVNVAPPHQLANNGTSFGPCEAWLLKKHWVPQASNLNTEILCISKRIYLKRTLLYKIVILPTP